MNRNGLSVTANDETDHEFEMVIFSMNTFVSKVFIENIRVS